MKKVYNKPQVFVEEFTVSQSIAGECGTDVGFSQSTCYLDSNDDFGKTIRFFDSSLNPQCTTNFVDDDTQGDKPCYHVPIATNKYFGS